MSKYEQIYENEWLAVRKRGHKNQCCDCGLVHNIDYRIKDGAQEIKLTTDRRATAAVRRAFKFTKD